MESNKDIFDLFKDNEHKLSEAPSNRAWERLEQRLDTETQKKKVSYYRHLAIAASTIALLAMAMVAGMYFQPQNQNIAMNVELEDLNVLSDSKININEAVDFVRLNERQLTTSIVEGTTGRRLQPMIRQ